MDGTHDIERLRAGDEDAYRALLGEFEGKVYNLCLGFVQDRAEARDLAQEVFLQVFRSVGRFRGEAKLSTWIYRIAVTKSLTHLRWRRRKRWLQSLAGRGREPVEERADGRPAADETIEREERRRLLLAAMGTLPESQRAALGLFCFERLPYERIAEVMNVTVPAVESLIFRARRGLRERLGGAPEK